MRAIERITLKDGERPIRFAITPMGAVQAERWLMQACFAIGITALDKVDISKPDESMMTALSAVDFEKVAPLWDQLLTGIEVEAENGAKIALTPETLAGKIEFPTTLFALKLAALKANFGFFANGGWQNFLSTMRGMLTSLK